LLTELVEDAVLKGEGAALVEERAVSPNEVLVGITLVELNKSEPLVVLLCQQSIREHSGHKRLADARGPLQDKILLRGEAIEHLQQVIFGEEDPGGDHILNAEGCAGHKLLVAVINALCVLAVGPPPLAEPGVILGLAFPDEVDEPLGVVAVLVLRAALQTPDSLLMRVEVPVFGLEGFPLDFDGATFVAVGDNRADRFDGHPGHRPPVGVKRQVLALSRGGLDRDLVPGLHRFDHIQVAVLVAVLPDPFFQEPVGLIGRVLVAPVGPDEPVILVKRQKVLLAVSLRLRVQPRLA
jgi:hypothetical protein